MTLLQTLGAVGSHVSLWWDWVLLDGARDQVFTVYARSRCLRSGLWFRAPGRTGAWSVNRAWGRRLVGQGGISRKGPFRAPK